MPGIHSRAQVVNTGQRWYQAKRVPLYIMVAGGFAGAATYLLGNRMEVTVARVKLIMQLPPVSAYGQLVPALIVCLMQHPGVEASQSQKSDSLAEEQPGAHQAGVNHHESSGRKASRSAGFHEGQV